MKGKECLKLSALAAMLILMLCMPVTAHAGNGMGNNPGQVPTGYKTVGPHAKGALLVGWNYVYTFTGEDETSEARGNVDAFLAIDGHTYFKLLDYENELETFKATTAADITTWDFPTDLADLYNLEGVTLVRVLYEKDVSTEVILNSNTYEFTPGEEEPVKIDPDNPYNYILGCEVKITFLTGEPIEE